MDAGVGAGDADRVTENDGLRYPTPGYLFCISFKIQHLLN
jgi:hypothetical protein